MFSIRLGKIGDGVSGGTSSSASGVYAQIDECAWLKHIRCIIMAGLLAAEKMHFERASVLVHCSDGW